MRLLFNSIPIIYLIPSFPSIVLTGQKEYALKEFLQSLTPPGFPFRANAGFLFAYTKRHLLPEIRPR